MVFDRSGKVKFTTFEIEINGYGLSFGFYESRVQTLKFRLWTVLRDTHHLIETLSRATRQCARSIDVNGPRTSNLDFLFGFSERSLFCNPLGNGWPINSNFLFFCNQFDLFSRFNRLPKLAPRCSRSITFLDATILLRDQLSQKNLIN